MTGQADESRRDEALHAIEREVGALIRRVRRVIGERARAVHPELQPSAYLILTYLEEQDDVRSSRLVENFGIDKGAVSRHLQHLATLGLVDKTTDPDDGRAALIEATDHAQARLCDTADERRRLWEDHLAAWSTTDLETLGSLLTRFNTDLHP